VREHGRKAEDTIIIARMKTGLEDRREPERYRPQVKLSVNVPADQGERLRTLAFEQRVSESSIVQVALRLLFGRGDDAVVGPLLREHGATLRRK